MIDNLATIFEKYEDEYLEFDRVENKSSNRPDLHAFILLDKLLPGRRDIVTAAEHDQIWLDVKPENLVDVATEAQIVELIRCGVLYSEDDESFYMFA